MVFNETERAAQQVFASTPTKVAIYVMAYRRADNLKEEEKHPFERGSALALQLLDYEVMVESGMAHYRMRQHYRNPLNTTINLNYKFPVSPNYVINGFKAKLGASRMVQGVIKEKNETKQLYKEYLNNGSTVSTAFIYEDMRDIMKVDLGNLDPFEEVVVEFDFSKK